MFDNLEIKTDLRSSVSVRIANFAITCKLRNAKSKLLEEIALL